MNTDHILMFIDYLLIPFLALGIDLARAGAEIKCTLSNFISYARYTIAIILIAYIVRVVLARIGVGVNTDPGTGMYTIMATVIALIAPYIKDMIVKYIDIRCEIKGKKD